LFFTLLPVSWWIRDLKKQKKINVLTFKAYIKLMNRVAVTYHKVVWKQQPGAVGNSVTVLLENSFTFVLARNYQNRVVWQNLSECKCCKYFMPHNVKMFLLLRYSEWHKYIPYHVHQSLASLDQNHLLQWKFTELKVSALKANMTKDALHELNQMVNLRVNHLVKCRRVARDPKPRLKLT